MFIYTYKLKDENGFVDEDLAFQLHMRISDYLALISAT